MNIQKLEVGMKVKNYKVLCELLNEQVLNGNSKIAQLKQWEQYFTWHKEGNAFIIDEIKSCTELPTNNDISTYKYEYTTVCGWKPYNF